MNRARTQAINLSIMMTRPAFDDEPFYPRRWAGTQQRTASTSAANQSNMSRTGGRRDSASRSGRTLPSTPVQARSGLFPCRDG